MGLLDSLFHDIQPDEYIEVRLIGADRRSQRSFYKTPAEATLAAQEVQEAGPTVNCYFGVAPRRGSTGGTKQDVSRVAALWTDLDTKDFNDDKARTMSALTGFILPPSYVIDSGHGFHAYWLLKSSCPVEQAEPLLRSLKELVGGDAVTDASRILRIPDTLNVKSEPFVECRTLTERAELRYSVRDVVAALQLTSETARRIATGDATGFKSRSERDWGVVRELLNRKVSREAIKAIFEYQAIGDKYKDAGDAYLDHTLSNAAEREGVTLAKGLPAGCAFYEVGDSWWLVTSKGKRQVSTFVFEPKRLLESADRGDVLYGTIRADGYEWKDIAFPRSSFTRIDSFTRVLTLASWQWLGSDREVRFLLPYLVSKWKEEGRQKARGVSMTGRHEDLWVWEGGAITSEGTLDNYESPIVFINTARVRSQTTYRLAEDREEFTQLLRQIAEYLPKINLPEVIWPILGWFMATPLKPVLEERSVRFPILDLYGTRGSGKSSTVLQAMLPLLGSKAVPAHSFDCSTTPFVLLTLLSSTNAVPISLGEYRQSSIMARTFENLRRAMLLAYDVGIDARGRPDQTTTEYALAAPFVVDGEDALGDPALLERAVVVNLTPETIATGTTYCDTFEELIKLPLGDFAGRYVQFTLGYDVEKIYKLWEAQHKAVGLAFHRPISTRVRRNLALVMTGVVLFSEFLASYGVEIEVPDHTVLEMCLDQVASQSLGRTTMLIDEFVTDIVNEVGQTQLTTAFHYVYDKTDNVLWFQLKPALNWWYALRRRIGRDTLQATSLQRQLKERVVGDSYQPGQYVIPAQARSLQGRTAWLHGIELTAAHMSGLDVPDKLALKQVTLTFREDQDA